MIFALFHLFLLLGIIILAFYSLFQGNVLRFALIIGLLIIYYFLALHKNILEEFYQIAFRKKLVRQISFESGRVNGTHNSRIIQLLRFVDFVSSRIADCVVVT